ncbi:MAG TPA: hypothetical protein VK524_13700, partial [Polyangiaceae bacterium]|nr:hypothetical protein [Polyangiaceae bacterium]
MTNSKAQPSQATRRARFALTAILLSMLAAPLLLTLATRLLRSETLERLVLAPLTNNARPRPRPAPTLATWRSREFQREFESWFASSLALRGPIVRATNQFYYSLFRRSHNVDLVVG